MGGSVFLSYWLFGLRHPALEFAGSWIEPGVGSEMRTSRRPHSTDIPWGLRLSVSPAVWTRTSPHRSSGLTFGLGTKIPQALWHAKFKKKKKKKERKKGAVQYQRLKNKIKLEREKYVRKNKTIIETTSRWEFLPSP